MLEEKYLDFEKQIKIKFQNKELLKQAFVHRSYINENKNLNLSHNERIEFLGDAVLELISTEYIFNKYPDKTEGEMTSYRSAIVNTQSLAEISQELEIEKLLLLSRGESKDIGRARMAILANTLEALIGAIYIDQGYDTTRKFIEEHLLFKITHIVSEKLWRDSKSYLQEKVQEKYKVTPIYKIMKEEGPDHDKSFMVSVFINDAMTSTGMGKSKQEAEQEAAKNELSKQGWN